MQMLGIRVAGQIHCQTNLWEKLCEGFPWKWKHVRVKAKAQAKAKIKQ